MRWSSNSPDRYRWPAVALVAVWVASSAFAGPPERTQGSAFAAPLPRGAVLSASAQPELKQETTANGPAIAATPNSYTPANTFMTAYLLPRMSARLDGFNSLVGSEIYRNQPVESVWRGDVDRSIEKQAIRATRAAAREYLVERWNLELDLHRGRAAVAGEESHTDPGSSKVRLGFAGARPRLIWLNDTKNGAVKLSVDSRGRFGAAWHNAADGKVGVAFAADPSNKRVEIGWANAF